MPTCWLKDVILATWCRWIYFSLLHLYFRFWFVTIKKNACQYLYFKMLLYISQNADMSAKWLNFCIKMSSNWFFNFTFVYQFLICDHLKKNACQYLYFKISLYRSQSPTCRQNDVILASRCRQIDFSMLHLYISF